MAQNKILKFIFGTEKPLSVILGTALALGITLVSIYLSGVLGDFFKSQFNLSKSLVSMFLLTIIIGILIRNIVKLPAWFQPGIKFCMSKLLRLGIILMGIRLSIISVAKIGAVAVIVASLCVLLGIVIALFLAKLFGISSRLGGLIAAGTSICGVSAIVATAPAIKAKEEETAYAISVITIFGLIVTVAYPYLVELVFGFNIAQAGIFIGTAVHETAQVTGAALIYDQMWSPKVISDVAITTKLVRNTFLMFVVPLLAMYFAARNKDAFSGESKGGFLKHFPVFVLGFVAFAIFRSIGDYFTLGENGMFLAWDASSWEVFWKQVKEMATFLLAIAISAVGLNTELRKLIRLSFRPFLVGLAASTAVGIVSFILVSVLNPFISSMLQTG